MEKNKLNVAPTEQELINAGFCKAGASNHSNYGKLIKRINDNLFVMFGGKKCSLRFDYGHVDTTIKEIEPTKAAINAEFKHFGQPLPQWEKPKPKVGEVWGNGWGCFLVVKSRNKNIEEEALDLEGIDKGFLFELSWKMKGNHKKLYNNLEDYYKEKLLKEGVATMLYEMKEETTETATLGKNVKAQTAIDAIEEMNKEIFKPTTINPKNQVEQPHQYSYKGLKADGKIPHDRSGEDYDSIEAFKKLLSICEALNGMFGGSDYRLPYYTPHGLDYDDTATQDESPICFTSSEAFDAFKSAPENVELFKTFLKIKRL